MVRRCNNVGVRIYVDAIINHMAAQQPDEILGTGGSHVDTSKYNYPEIGYMREHFNGNENEVSCGVNDFENAVEVRNCDLFGLQDLNQTHPYVQEKIIELLNNLTHMGVAGYRIDAARHIWPSELKKIYDNLRPLNTTHGFAQNQYPFIFQEVSDGPESRWTKQYTPLAAVTEFRYSKDINRVFRGQVNLVHLKNWGTGWAYLPSEDVLVFITNHDNQRDGAKDRTIMTHHSPREYRMANAWALAHPYGNLRIMSSYAFLPWERDLGPPQDTNGQLISPLILSNGQCGNGYVCEHRWPLITKMVEFRNVAGDSSITDWWDNGLNQIAFCRGNKAFIAFNKELYDLKRDLKTCLPSGEYCDIITGERVGNTCTGMKVVVDSAQNSFIYIPYDAEDSILAIHIGPTSKIQ